MIQQIVGFAFVLAISLVLILSHHHTVVQAANTQSKFPLYALGSNYLLLGNTNIYKSPRLIDTKGILKDDESFLKVSAGSNHNVVIVGKEGDIQSRRLYGWGSNTMYQLIPHGTTNPSGISKLTEIELPENNQLIDVDLTRDLTCLLLQSTVDLSYSMQCLGATQNSKWTAQFDSLLENDEKLIKIKASNHVSILSDKGNVFSIGRNEHGQFGDGTHFSYDETSFHKANTQNVQVSQEKIIDITLGPISTFYLTDKGFIYHSGAKKQSIDEADLNLIPTKLDYFTNEVTYFSAADKSLQISQQMKIAVATKPNLLFEWLIDQDPEKIDGIYEKYNITSLHQQDNNLVLILESEDGKYRTVGTFGDNEYGQSSPNYGRTALVHVWDPSVFLNDKIESAEIGSSHVVAHSKKRLWAWGDNSFSQCGVEHPKPALLPKLVYEFNEPLRIMSSSRTGSILVTQSGKAYSYGRNTFNLLAHKNEIIVNLPKPIDSAAFDSDDIIQSADISIGHTFFSTAKGKVYGVGKQEMCRMGNLDTTRSLELLTFGSRNISKVETGFFHTLFFSPSTGSDSLDQLGVGIIFGVGLNSHGQLGIEGDRSDSQYCNPQIISFSKVTFLEDEKLVGIDAGEFHSLAYTNKNRIFAWGQGMNATLLKLPTLVNLNLESDESITHVSSGSDFSAVLTSKHRFFGFGKNSYGNLDGISNKTDSRYRAAYYYDAPLNIGQYLIELGVIKKDEVIVDAAVTLSGIGIYTSKERFLHFGDIFLEEDAAKLKFVDGTSIRTVDLPCGNENVQISGGSSTLIYISCEEKPKSFSKMFIIIMLIGLALGFTTACYVASALTGVGIYQKIMTTSKANAYTLLPMTKKVDSDKISLTGTIGKDNEADVFDSEVNTAIDNENVQEDMLVE